MSEKSIILIIDDQLSEVKMMKMALEKGNYKVICAYDPTEGINKAKQEMPDVIILDILMPEKDGLKIAEELRSDKDCCMIPFIVLTDAGDIFSPSDTIKGPFIFNLWDEYLEKPINKSILLGIVKKTTVKKKQYEG